MKRREFITLLGSAAVACPLAARAQPKGKVWRVGWTWCGRSAGNPDEVAGFRQGLKDFGYIEGQNVIVEYRFGENRPEHFADIVSKLVQMRPDVLVASCSPIVSLIKRATVDIPVVFFTGDPVGAGFVASLARPGGNLTGVSMMQGVEGLTGKRIEILKDAVPAATRIGYLYNPDLATGPTGLAQAQQVANHLSLTLRPAPARRGDEIEAVISGLARDGIDGLHVEPVAPFVTVPREIGELVLKHRIPAISEIRSLAVNGGLLSYGPNVFEMARRQTYFVDRILKGAKPADLPVEQPTRFELVVNLKTAKALGLTVPPTLLARATEVID